MNSPKIIDFHIHFFPDKLAEKAIDVIAKRAGVRYYTDGTQADTLKKLRGWGVDQAVFLPIATKPSQQQTINNFAASVKSDYFFAYGSVHPLADDALQELDRIKELGLLGIKLHPEYQEFYFDDPKAMKVFARCGELGLPVIYHAGEDIGFLPPYHSEPQRVARVLDQLPDVTFIAAHMGGYRLWHDVLKYLAGRNIYFDTGFIAGQLNPQLAAQIIRAHGSDKILFGSDCPWTSSADTIDYLDLLELSDEDKAAIYSGNALRLLGVK